SFLGMQSRFTGNPKRTIEIFTELLNYAERPGSTAPLMFRVNGYRWLINALADSGRFDEAEASLKRLETALQQPPSSPLYVERQDFVHAQAELARALVMQ